MAQRFLQHYFLLNSTCFNLINTQFNSLIYHPINKLFIHLNSGISQTKFFSKGSIILCLLIAFIGRVESQTIFTNPITAANPSSNNPFTSGQTVNPNLTVTGIGFSGVTANSVANRFNASNWSTSGSINTGKYFSWTLTPATCNKLNLTSLVINYTVSNSSTSPKIVLRSNVDGYAANIGTVTTVSSTSTTSLTINLSAAAFQNRTTATTFRLYLYSINSTTSTFGIEDFTFNGSVASNLNTVGTASSTPTLCINTALTAITHGTTGASGIGTATGLPSGVSAAFASNTITISGTPTSSGTFNYSIPLTGGCGSVNATGTINVNPNNTAGTASANPTLCINTPLTAITRTTTGATGIGTATGLPAGVSASWTSNTLSISGTPTVSGTYNYSIPLVGGCGSVNATGTITVNPLSVGGSILGSTSKCAGVNSSTLTLSGYTGSIIKWQSSSSSTFASGVNDIVNTSATYTPINLTTTTYYRAVVQSGVCGSVNSSTATITITQPGSGNFSYASYGFCTSSSSPQAISTSNFTGVSGTFSSSLGLSINTSTGSILPSISTASTTPYIVTYSIPASGGCSAYSTTTLVTIDGVGTGSIVYSPSTLCTGTSGTVSPIITGAGGSGASTWVNASPSGMAIDGSGIITPSSSAPGTYNVTYYRSASGLCPTYSSSTSVTINSSPTITSTTPGSRCGAGSVVLSAVSSNGTVYWYTAATGGTNLGSGNTFNTPSISTNTTYYADATDVNGCVSGTRTPVLATVKTIPSITSTTPDSNCGPGILNLGATTSAGTINWYVASTGGTSVGSGTSFNTPSISTTTNYYAESISNGCSSTRSVVTATINAIPTVTSATAGSNCGAGTVNLSATSSGNLNWYATSSGGISIGSGSSFTTPNISTTTTFYVDATSNGCTSARSSVIATIATSPSISSFINGARCNPGAVNLSATPSIGATIKWYSAPSGGTLLNTGNSYTTPFLSSTATYYLEASYGSCIQPSRTAITATINTTPIATITADYCSVPGNVVLSANSGMSTYLWSNGGNTESINVDQAGSYSLVILSPAGCMANTSISIASELVVNGNFNAGNTGFTTNYSYRADVAGQSEMYPEGTYAVLPNPNDVHNAFYGQDRHSSAGNIMVINGSPSLGAAVWNQNNTTVLPNTTYYFSAWAMSVVNGNNAILQFSINGSQVGTIAYLPNGYSSTSGPYNWVRFYGQWESGPSTTANLSIVNLNTILGGNDFALDDISFGTMAPVALNVSPIVSGNSICQNEPLILNAGAAGGASPFSYSWTGPNGFTSILENPVVTTSATSNENGIYTLIVTDGFGCTSTQNVAVSVSAAPSTITISAATSTVCSGGSTNINLSTSEIGVYYQLRNNATNVNIGALIQGTGSTLSLPTGILSSTTTFNVLATRYPANCDVQMPNTITVTLSVTPELNITNQAACSGTVNLLAAAVTSGSTGSGSLSYWTTSAATTAVTTPSAVGSGTYFIKSTNGSCFDIEPVVVSISSTPNASFNFASSSYCTTGIDPLPTVSGTTGVFTSNPVGLVFTNTNTGEIDLSASTPGTYNVINTVSPFGACSPVSVIRSLTITAAPLAGFNYVSNDLCQSANALNASPIFDAGASAGSFSTSAGLSLDAISGVINVSESTPGNYAVVNTRSATGGCPANSDTTYIDINPYIFTGSVLSSTSDDIICLNETVDLFSNATSYATVLLRETFNGTINNWTTTNTSIGGTPANAAWTLRSTGYVYNSLTFNGYLNSQFYMSNSRAQGGGGTTNTILKSPVMSTIGFSSLSLDFFTYYEDLDGTDNAKVQLSTNNTTWVDIANYTSDLGTSTGFSNQVISLNDYIGLPTVYIRFVYTGGNDRYWAIDNVSITGNSINYGYAWAASPAGYTSSLQNPTDLTPTVNTFYTVTATNSYGCSTPASPVPVTVNPLPADHAGIDQNICGSGNVTLGATSTIGNTYTWSPSTSLSNATISQPVASPTSTTTYTLTETITETGCSIQNDVIVGVTPLPIIISTIPAGRCGNGTVTLNAVSSTGTLKWYANATGGVALGTSNSFTTPSISSNTTYFVEATSSTCNATSRIAVVASINANPSITSQSTASATYSQNVLGNALTVTASAGSGTISGYQWFSNTIASTSGANLINGATSNSYVPSTTSAGTSYYFCEITNSNGCSVNSAVSGAITTLLSPSISSVNGTLPIVSGQATNSGYRGQRLTIVGTNFASNATVTLNGIAATVTFINSTQLTAIVNNSGVNSTGNLVVTNPSTGANTTSAFSYIGYLTNANSDWNSGSTWLGNSSPTSGSNATIVHTITTNSVSTISLNEISIGSSGIFNLTNNSNAITINNLNVNGSIVWVANGTISITETINLSGSAIFTAGGGTVLFNKAGDQQLFNGQALVTFNNLSLGGSGNKSLGVNSDIVVKNLIIGSGTTFNLSTSDSEVMVKGDLTVNGNMTVGTSAFHFTGTVDQNISVIGSGTAVFSAMKVNKSSGTLLLNDHVIVQDSLKMIQGIINTQSSILEIGYDVTHTGTIFHTSGYVSGKLRRWFSANTNASANSGIFPMGQYVNNSWKNRTVQLNYTEAPSNGGYLTIEFMPIPMINGSLGTQSFIQQANTGGAGFTVTNFSNDGYWKVDNQANTLIDGEYTISLTGEGFALPNGLNEITLVKRVNGGDWFCPGVHLSPLGTISSPVLRRSGVSGFSNFGFAGGPSNALPITLLNFSAECISNAININWTSSSEANNKEYTIEESYDAIIWRTIETIPGANNSTTLNNYSTQVNNTSPNGSYFRLTQTDYNGNNKTFDPIYIRCENELRNTLNLFPNPANDYSVLEINSENNMDIQITLFSSNGQIVFNQKTELQKGKNLVQFDISSLASGIFHYHISNNQGVDFKGNRTLIKQ